MSSFKISIVIPTYNEEKYIGKTLNALINQNYKNFEVIIVDSDSKDKTKKEALKFRKKLNLKFYNIKERGIGKARNFGALKSKGKILLFIDADTILPRDTLKKVVKEFENDKLIGLTFLYSCYDGNLVDKFIYKLASIGMVALSLFNIYHFPGFFSCYKKEFFNKEKFNEKLKHSEDVDLSLRMRKYGKLKIVKSYIYTSSRRLKKVGRTKLIIKDIKRGLFFYLKKKVVGDYKAISEI